MYIRLLQRFCLLWFVLTLTTLKDITNHPITVQAAEKSQVPRDLPPPAPRQLEPKLPPPPEELLKPSPQPKEPNEQPIYIPGNITVKEFKVEGSTIFTKKELDAVTKKFTGRPISFKELTAARSAINQLYTAGCQSDSRTQLKRRFELKEIYHLDKNLYKSIIKKSKSCYVNSGAYLPEQDFENGGEVTIKVIEGELEEKIKVTGTKRLNRNYIRSRLAIATGKPLNLDHLQQALQLLRLNPLIKNISAELSATTRPDKSLLSVAIEEAPSLKAELNIDNGRSPSVGSFRRGIQLTEANLLGFGDSLNLSYTNTDGSNGIGLNYTLPLNPHNTTLELAYGNTNSNVIEPPFDVLGIESNSRYYELTLRHPLLRKPTEQFDVGLNFSRRESETSLSFENIGPFPISTGADERGRTRVSAVRFFQQWTKSKAKEVLAFRSQFSLGLDAFNSTINNDVPDSRFFSWLGQGQWLRLINKDTELLLRAEVQLADNSLLSMEQFGIGGLNSVRGYRQDALFTDNGILASAELRLPILRVSQVNGLLQLTPFIEFGGGWNHDAPNPDPNTLLSTGLGLRWRMGDYFLARFDWGIPLVSFSSSERTLQEQGLYFSVLWNPF